MRFLWRIFTSFIFLFLLCDLYPQVQVDNNSPSHVTLEMRKKNDSYDPDKYNLQSSEDLIQSPDNLSNNNATNFNTAQNQIPNCNIQSVNIDDTEKFHPALPVVQTGSRTQQTIYSLLCVIAILSCAYLLIKYIKNKKKVQKIYTPLEILLQNFNIAKQKMSYDDPKEFAEILSMSVREFINTKYRLPSTTKTSEEFLKYFQHSKIFHHDIYFQFVEFFSVVDDVKFAGRNLTQNEKQQLFIKSCRLLSNFRRNFRAFKSINK